MPHYRLLAIDIDGTLVNSRDELTPAVRAALDRAGRSGIRVVLATGRRYRRTLPLVAPLGIDVPLVTAGGALVKDPADHRTLFKAEFEEELLRKVAREIDRCGYDPVLSGDTFSEGFDFYLARANARNDELAEYLTLNPHAGRVWPDLLSAPPPGVFQCCAMGGKEEMLAVERRLHKAFPGRLASHVVRPPRYCGFLTEVFPAGVSKWSGVRHLAEQWGIADGEICAVGDDVNDIPMIRAAGLGVAMGNALPEVKAAADRIAPTHDDEGLVQVVAWLLDR
ncbi:MAG: HAD family phosphatase [Pirellulales bacterium]|nr:HAD family phosphatase [Pirellulales bacterium]